MDNDIPIVQGKSLKVQFPGCAFPAFAGINFSVPHSSIFGIFGETGCGKSTLAQCLIGFIPPGLIEGEIAMNFGEREIKLSALDEIGWRKIRGQSVVYVPQDPYKSLNPYERIGHQLKRVVSAYRRQIAPSHLLEKVGLCADLLHSFPRMMSAGQRQRALIALALAVEPKLLILDEPTASTDAQGRAMLRDCFCNLAKQGATLMIISHEVDEYLPIIARENRLYFSRVTSTAIQARHKSRRTNPEYGPTAPLLELIAVKKNFNGLAVLNALDLQVRANEWIYLEGSNGTGKSTLLRIIMGVEKPDGGAFQWQNRNISWRKVNDHTKSFIHPVFQDAFHSLDPRQTVGASIREVIRCAHRKHRDDISQKAKHLWKHLGLPAGLETMLPHQLSYGQQKRVVFIRTLLKYHLEKQRTQGAFHLFLFDEVFAGIHWVLRDKIIFLLQEMRKDGDFSIIWVAHGHEVLQDMCDTVYRLKNGKLQKPLE